ncbi:NAD(P)H-dependent flavin oxidoreductase [Streptomyces fuscichromogenes]|uniref:NAD(P)H-dependent flavin oxidoreductase n=1 Tax=Streptomyces fuscichromogenes TaxID=1324013 RepID=UPI003800D8E4
MTGSDRARGLLPAGLPVAFPLVQAGMGGIATPQLAAAVSDAGALGTIALYKLSADSCRAAVLETATLTSRPFGVNVIPEVVGDPLLRAQVTAAANAMPDDRPMVLNSYGLPPSWLASELEGSRFTLMVQVGTPADAARAADLGARTVVLQGTEAGGHLLGQLPLTELLTKTRALNPPVHLVAAGGIEDGRRLCELGELGAEGWLLGTAFVAARESGAHELYKTALIDADGAADTVVSDRFEIGWPGRRHRVLRSTVTDSPSPLPSQFIAWTSVAGRRHPVPRGSAAVPTTETTGRIDEMARYAGQGCGAVRAVLPAADIVDAFRHSHAHAAALSTKESVTHGT